MVNFPVSAPAILIAGLVAAAPSLADAAEPSATAPQASFSPATAAEARRVVEGAIPVVQKMTSDDRVSELLMQSKGVFIVPSLMKGGLVVGGRGGEGVLLIHRQGTWSNPAFFDLGAITFGAQAGGAVGHLAMLLMSEEAVRSFAREDEFALDASAGLSVFGYDVVSRADTQSGDVVVWSDQGGAFAGATIGASDISVDEAKNHAYYQQPVELDAILEGKVDNPQMKLLQEELPGGA